MVDQVALMVDLVALVVDLVALVVDLVALEDIVLVVVPWEVDKVVVP